MSPDGDAAVLNRDDITIFADKLVTVSGANRRRSYAKAIRQRNYVALMEDERSSPFRQRLARATNAE